MNFSNTSKTRKRNGPSPEQVRRFRKTVTDYYRRSGRDLPWRNTRDPYLILVSEIMLQQTQVERVLRKYPEFIGAFPDFPALARAPLARMLDVWRGMGYPRRCLALKRIAERVIVEFDGHLPSDTASLLSLPSIGKATAASILAFAFDRPTVFIETNIRAVFIHAFFPDADRVTDAMIEPYVSATLDENDPRSWYYALMDYGVALKKRFPGLLGRSAHYTKQSPFRGSHRELRSAVLGAVVGQTGITPEEIVVQTDRDAGKVSACLSELVGEGFIREKKGRFFIA
jgi:A/G-specific adenine glycosylase